MSVELWTDHDDAAFAVFASVSLAPVEACAVCNTAVKLIPQVGWVHLRGFQERDGCMTPWPKIDLGGQLV